MSDAIFITKPRAKLGPKWPPKPHIAALRKGRGWSMQQLADASGIGHRAIIERLEKGGQKLREDYVEMLARALNVTHAVIWGEEPIPEPLRPGLCADAEPFDISAISGQSSLQITLADTHFPYRVKTRTLDKLGIIPGDVAVFDCSAARLQALRDGDVVVAQHCGLSVQGITILRQHLLPSLLVTNSQSNLMSLDTDKDSVFIKGVMIAVHRWK